MFYVTCNDISVIYATAQICRRTEEVVPTVGLLTPKTFRRFLLSARPTPTQDYPFYTVIPTQRPIQSPFTTRWGYTGRILDLKPKRPHGGKILRISMRAQRYLATEINLGGF